VNRRGKGPWWVTAFRNQGLRITEPRQAVLDVMQKMSGHHSADEIFFRVHRLYPGIGLATIYRTLDLLTRLGLVKKHDFGQGRARYELITKEAEHHHHLICEGCGKVIDYNDFMNEEKTLVKKIEEVLSKKHNFKIKSHNLQFYGLCENCQKRR